MATITGYTVSGFDLRLYCKVTEMGIDTPDYKCILSFGTGMKRFCLTAMYDKQKPTELYIDRVENNDLCVVDGKLSNYDKGTVKLVKTALCVINELFPEVTTLTLHDASQIYCEEESKLFKLGMSYDYIIKYNETWYQKNFHAILPGFISKHYDANREVQITAEPDTIMDIYSKSLHVLDAPRMDYSLLSNRFTQFDEYKEEYESSTTPRDFINKLRRTLGDKYCFVVGKWLNQYMALLQIKLSPEHWYILSSTIEPVPHFKMDKMNKTNTMRLLEGGNKTRRRTKRGRFTIIADSAFTG